MQAIQLRAHAHREPNGPIPGRTIVRRPVARKSSAAPPRDPQRRLHPAAALALTALASAACTTGGIPILAPGEAKLGATALVFVDTNGIPNGDLYEHYDLSRDNVTLGIEDAAGVQVFAPRAVVGFQDLRTAETVPNDILKGAGRQIFAAVFDIPESLTFPSFPATTAVRVMRNGIELWEPARRPPLTITGPGGTATSFLGGLELHEPQPQLRLRAQGPSAGAFDDTWLIGSLSFRLVYPAALSNPQAHPTAEATSALAMVDPIDATSARVLLVEPSGFALRETDFSNSAIGTGPFLDVVFTKTGPFETGEFAIEDLVATDRDGNELLREPGDATALFQLLAVRNQ